MKQAAAWGCRGWRITSFIGYLLQGVALGRVEEVMVDAENVLLYKGPFTNDVSREGGGRGLPKI